MIFLHPGTCFKIKTFPQRTLYMPGLYTEIYQGLKIYIYIRAIPLILRFRVLQLLSVVVVSSLWAMKEDNPTKLRFPESQWNPAILPLYSMILNVLCRFLGLFTCSLACSLSQLEFDSSLRMSTAHVRYTWGLILSPAKSRGARKESRGRTERVL